MSTPRKHHYLPQFYLREFLSDRRRRSLTQIFKDSGHQVTCAIKDVAASRDYHRLDADDVDDPYELEHDLSKDEDKLATATRRVLEHGVVDRTTHARLVKLVAMLRVRVPAITAKIEEACHQFVQSGSLIMERAKKLPPLTPDLEDVLKLDNPDISNQIWSTLAQDEDTLRLLRSMTPTVIRAPDGEFFLTGDQPVAVFSPSAKLSRSEGVDLKESDVEISLPLSRDTLIRLDWKSGGTDSVFATPEEVSEFNRRTVIMASNYVFAPNANAAAASEIVQRYRQFSAGLQPPQTRDGGGSVIHKLFFRPVVSRDQYPDAGTTG